MIIFVIIFLFYMKISLSTYFSSIFLYLRSIRKKTCGIPRTRLYSFSHFFFFLY